MWSTFEDNITGYLQNVKIVFALFMAAIFVIFIGLARRML
jgi:hypothetical protein